MLDNETKEILEDSALLTKIATGCAEIDAGNVISLQELSQAVACSDQQNHC